MSDIKKQRVIVTGGSKGLGRGIALAFAEAGASVVIADVDTAIRNSLYLSENILTKHM